MLRNRQTYTDIFNRRSFILGLGQVGLIGLLAGRLQYLQIAQGEKYVTLAEDNRVNIEPLASPRGRLLDRAGRVLARDDQSFQIILIPEQVESIDHALDQISEIVPVSAALRRDVLRRVKRARRFQPITVVDNMDWNSFARASLNEPLLEGIVATVGDKRIYPEGPAVAHYIGYVGREGKRDERARAYPFSGRSGLEKLYEEQLKGRPGDRRVEVNVMGRTIRELERNKGMPGENVVLAVDRDIQQVAYDALNGRSGSVVMVDCVTGEIYCLVSAPSFDPNAMAVGIDSQTWQTLTEDEKKPLMNKALAGLYAPGSTFKMIVALAALQAGVATASTRRQCTGHYEFGDRRFHCWEKDGHGWLDMEQAIAHSCDVYFYDLALQTGIDAIHDMAKKFGLGEALGLGLEGEKKGVMPNRDWKRANFDTRWEPGETLITGIGQGYILTSPAQLALMVARIASGLKVIPQLERASQDVIFEPLDIPEEHLAVIRRGMNAVMNVAGGTAFGSRINVKGRKMAGKTGTVQVRRISEAERLAGVIDNADLPWRLRDHALFVGYAPSEVPRYAISVVVEHGGSGSRAAAPVAKTVMGFAMGQMDQWLGAQEDNA